MKDRIVWLLCLVAIAALGGCSGSGGGGGALPSAVPNQPGSVGSSSTAKRIVYFSSSQQWYANVPPTIWGFDGSGTGSESPIRTIQNANYTAVQGLATDAAGDVYTAFYPANSASAVIAEYGPNDDTHPIRTIVDNAQLKEIDSVGAAPDGTIFVLDEFAPPGCLGVTHLLVFSPTSNGNAVPIRDISGPNTQLVPGGVIAIGPDGSVYWGYYTQGMAGAKILRFGPSANGNVPADAVISGSNAQLGGPIDGMATSSTSLVVSTTTSITLGTGAILDFPLDANGNVSPSNEISLAQRTVSLAVDSTGNRYAYEPTNRVYVFAPDASGNATPINVFEPVAPIFNGCGSCTFINNQMAVH